jgi:hypothetical protein
LFADLDFAAVFPDNGQPALSPVRLMLILILQFMEGYRIGKLLMQSGHKSTGSISCAWN